MPNHMLGMVKGSQRTAPVIQWTGTPDDDNLSSLTTVFDQHGFLQLGVSVELVKEPPISVITVLGLDPMRQLGVHPHFADLCGAKTVWPNEQHPRDQRQNTEP